MNGNISSEMNELALAYVRVSLVRQMNEEIINPNSFLLSLLLI